MCHLGNLPVFVQEGGGPAVRTHSYCTVVGNRAAYFFVCFNGKLFRNPPPHPQRYVCVCACVSSWTPVPSWKESLNPNSNSRPRFSKPLRWGIWKSKDKIVSECLSGQFMVIMRPNEVVRKIKCYLPKNLVG